MEDSAREAALTCPQCGSTADTGRIFCANCGTPLRAPVPLITQRIQAPAKRKSTKLKWTLVALGLFLFGYFAWQCGSGMRAGARLSDEAVRHFHAQLDSEAYDDIVRESDVAFQNSEPRDEL